MRNSIQSWLARQPLGRKLTASIVAAGSVIVTTACIVFAVYGGLEATAAIREREKQTGGHLRIVAMTAHA